jgi:hypothetical protein
MLTPRLDLRFVWPAPGVTVLPGKFHQLMNHGTICRLCNFATGHQVQGLTPADGFAGRELYLVYCSVNSCALFIRSVDKITSGDPFFVPESGR